MAQQRQSLQDFQRNAPAAAFHRLDNALAKSEVAEIDQVRRSLPDLLKRKKRPRLRWLGLVWVGAANSRISPMTAAVWSRERQAYVGEVEERAARLEREREERDARAVADERERTYASSTTWSPIT